MPTESVTNFDDLKVQISPCPRGGDWLEDDLARWQSNGVKVVVSLLEPREARELRLDREAEFCERLMMQFESLSIVDRGVPDSMRMTVEFLRRLRVLLHSGNGIVIHCRQGLGRAPMIAAGLMVMEGMSASDALAWAEKVRGVNVPETEEQIEWVSRLEKALRVEIDPDAS